MNITYHRHAVRRMLLRQIPLHVVEKVATVGVPVKETSRMVLMRGQWGQQAIHVLKAKKTNTVHTVYIADEWHSSITVTRMKRTAPVNTRKRASGKPDELQGASHLVHRDAKCERQSR